MDRGDLVGLVAGTACIILALFITGYSLIASAH